MPPPPFPLTPTPSTSSLLPTSSSLPRPPRRFFSSPPPLCRSPESSSRVLFALPPPSLSSLSHDRPRLTIPRCSFPLPPIPSCFPLSPVLLSPHANTTSRPFAFPSCPASTDSAPHPSMCPSQPPRIPLPPLPSLLPSRPALSLPRCLPDPFGIPAVLPLPPPPLTRKP